MDGEAARIGPSPETAANWIVAERVGFLHGTLGVQRTAEVLGVSPQLVSSWETGNAVPNPEFAGRLLDLDYAVAFAVQAWTPAVAADWLTSANGFLAGARPLDALSAGKAAAVVEALRATISGAYV